MSSRLVSQQPSRKNPVIGSMEQNSRRSPSTLRGTPGRPPPFPLSSLSIFVSRITFRLTRAQHVLGTSSQRARFYALFPIVVYRSSNEITHQPSSHPASLRG